MISTLRDKDGSVRQVDPDLDGHALMHILPFSLVLIKADMKPPPETHNSWLAGDTTISFELPSGPHEHREHVVIIVQYRDHVNAFKPSSPGLGMAIQDLLVSKRRGDSFGQEVHAGNLDAFKSEFQKFLNESLRDRIRTAETRLTG